MSFEVLLSLGIVSGLVTTLVGVGGGMLMVVGLSFFFDIHTVLALTAPALLIGNLGRSLAMRRSIHRRTVVAFTLGSIPGVGLGAWLLANADELVLRHALGAAAFVYVLLTGLREMHLLRARRGPPLGDRGLAGAGVACGLVAASVGGGGLVVAPALGSRRLERESFVATAAAVASAIHLTRVAGYGALGVASGPVLLGASVLSGAILVGNTLGRRLLGRLSAKSFRLGLLVVVALMATVLELPL